MSTLYIFTRCTKRWKEFQRELEFYLITLLIIWYHKNNSEPIWLCDRITQMSWHVNKSHRETWGRILWFKIWFCFQNKTEKKQQQQPSSVHWKHLNTPYEQWIHGARRPRFLTGQCRLRVSEPGWSGLTGTQGSPRSNTTRELASEGIPWTNSEALLLQL